MPRRWVPGDTWVGGSRVSDAPVPRRSALTPLPEDDDDLVSAPRRSAMSPGEGDDDEAGVPRRSALSPLPPDDLPAARPRRSAFTPTEPDDGEPAPRRGGWAEEDDALDHGDKATSQPSVPRHSSEYALPARAIQPALPELGPTAESAPSPVEAFSPLEPPATHAASPFSPFVQPALPDPFLSGPIEAAFANTELLPDATPARSFDQPWRSTPEPDGSRVSPPPVAPVVPLAVPDTTEAAAAVAAQVQSIPEITELPAALVEEQELLAEESDMVSEGAPPPAREASLVGDDTATWLFGSAMSDADHSLYRRPAPGEPETQVDLTPIVIDDPEYDVRKGTKPLAKSSPRPRNTGESTPSRGRSARRVQAAWRDHRRLLTITAIVLALLLVVGVGGYLLSRYNPTLASITEGKLSLPAAADGYQRDPAQGATPSADPNGKIQTVSAVYSLNGSQVFVAIAYRPQTDASAALQEIQARSIMKVEGGACGHSMDQNRLACAVVSGTTAVLLVTLVDQSADELIAAAQSVSAGIGKT